LAVDNQDTHILRSHAIFPRQQNQDTHDFGSLRIVDFRSDKSADKLDRHFLKTGTF